MTHSILSGIHGIGSEPNRPVPSGPPSAALLGRLGELEVRLAATAGEVRRAQRLRFRVFVDEMGARPSGLAARLRRDADVFDQHCDHLLVLDHDVPTRPFRRPRPEVVGTYRLLRGEVARRTGGFYSAAEFAVGPLLERHPHRSFVELGRSCVAPAYRDRRTIELLWAGISAYVGRHGADVMIGCASLPGTDPARLAGPLRLLRRAAAPPEWSVGPLPGLAAADIPSDPAFDERAALGALPPLVKAYLRVGAWVGEGAAVDRRFGTTDVFVVLPIERIGARYLAHFAPDGTRYAG